MPAGATGEEGRRCLSGLFGEVRIGGEGEGGCLTYEFAC